MVGVYKEDDIAFAELFAQVIALLRQCRGVDNGGCHIVGGSYGRWKSDLGEDGLDPGRNKYIFDEAGLSGQNRILFRPGCTHYQTGFASTFITAQANAHCSHDLPNIVR